MRGQPRYRHSKKALAFRLPCLRRPPGLMDRQIPRIENNDYSTLRQIPATITRWGGVRCGALLLPRPPHGGPLRCSLPLSVFLWGIPMFTPLECRLRAAECQGMVAHAPNSRVQGILTDMARTWTRLALEAERTLKQSRLPLQLIEPNPPPPPATWQAAVPAKYADPK
jgi:hypothetical protein